MERYKIEGHSKNVKEIRWVAWVNNGTKALSTDSKETIFWNIDGVTDELGPAEWRWS